MSKASERKFKREREAHYALEREKEAERAQARLKGFKPATSAEMTHMVLGISQPLEGTPVGNRRQRRAR